MKSNRPHVIESLFQAAFCLLALNLGLPPIGLFAAESADPDGLIAAFAKYDDGQPAVPMRNIENYLRGQSPEGRAAFEPRLIALLENPSTTPAGQRIIAGWLGWAGSARAVPALEKMAATTFLASSTAIASLASIPDEAAETALIRLLDAAPQTSRATVINALGQRRSTVAFEGLVKAATAKDSAIATAAMDALVRLGKPEALATLLKLHREDPTSVPRARSMLKAAGELLRQPAADTPALKRSDMLDAVTVVLNSSAATPLRIDAANILIAADAQTAGPRLLPLLHDRDQRLARHVARQLVLTGRSRDLDALVSGFDRFASPVQQALVTAAYARARPDALPLAKAGFASRDTALRAQAALVMGRCGDAAIVEALVGSLNAGPPLGESVRRALGLLPPGATDQKLLEQMQAAKEPALRAALLGILADRQDPGAWPLALAMCADAEPVLHSAGFDAMERLARPGHLAAVLALRPCARTASDDRIWSKAVVATASVDPKPDQAVALIERALAEPSSKRETLIGALTKIRCDRAAAALRAMVWSSDPAVRKETIRALSSFHGDTPLDLLREVAQKTPEADEKVLALRGYLQNISALRFREPPAPVSLVVEQYRLAWSIASRTQEKESILAALRQIKGKPAEDLLKELGSGVTPHPPR